MANRADGGRKTGCGPTVPRTDSILDFDLSKRSRWDKMKPFYLEGVVTPDPHSRGYRDFYKRTLEEFRLALGWGKIHKQELFVSIRDWPKFESLFFVDLPVAYSRTCSKYVFDACRLYPGKLRHESLNRPVKFAVFDFARENRLRIREAVKDARNIDSGCGRMGFQIIVEKIYDCFYDGLENHDIDLEFTQRVSPVAWNRKPKR